MYRLSTLCVVPRSIDEPIGQEPSQRRFHQVPLALIWVLVNDVVGYSSADSGRRDSGALAACPRPGLVSLANGLDGGGVNCCFGDVAEPLVGERGAPGSPGTAVVSMVSTVMVVRRSALRGWGVISMSVVMSGSRWASEPLPVSVI
ncbi:unnamed protein product, partial [Clonostachys rhizophaga]